MIDTKLVWDSIVTVSKLSLQSLFHGPTIQTWVHLKFFPSLQWFLCNKPAWNLAFSTLWMKVSDLVGKQSFLYPLAFLVWHDPINYKIIFSEIVKRGMCQESHFWWWLWWRLLPDCQAISLVRSYTHIVRDRQHHKGNSHWDLQFWT